MSYDLAIREQWNNGGPLGEAVDRGGAEKCPWRLKSSGCTKEGTFSTEVPKRPAPSLWFRVVGIVEAIGMLTADWRFRVGAASGCLWRGVLDGQTDAERVTGAVRISNTDAGVLDSVERNLTEGAVIERGSGRFAYGHDMVARYAPKLRDKVSRAVVIVHQRIWGDGGTFQRGCG